MNPAEAAALREAIRKGHPPKQTRVDVVEKDGTWRASELKSERAMRIFYEAFRDGRPVYVAFKRFDSYYCAVREPGYWRLVV